MLKRQEVFSRFKSQEDWDTYVLALDAEIDSTSKLPYKEIVVDRLCMLELLKDLRNAIQR